MIKFLNKKKFTQINKALKEIMRFDPKIPVENAFTPPSSWYLDQDIYDMEMEKIFRTNWIGVRGNFNMNEKGNYFAGNIAGQPFVIVNTSEDPVKPDFKAYYNVCSHKAAEVISGNGKCHEFSCPYHGWTYNLDGNLTKATSMKGIQNFKNKNFGLKPIKLKVYANTFFLNFSTDKVDDFDEYIKPYQNDLKIFNHDENLSNMHFIKRKEYKMNANWKLYAENFSDGDYHIPYLHTILKNWTFNTTDTVSNHNKLVTQTSFEKIKQGKLAEREGVFGFFYPNTMIGIFDIYSHIVIAEPISATESNMIVESYIREDHKDRQDLIEDALKLIEHLHLEDIFICESVTRGLRSNAYDVGRYSPAKEKGIHHIHKMVYEDLVKQ